MIKAGIFDVGGVLHDSSTQYIFADIKKTLEIDEKTLQNAWRKPYQLLAKGSINEKDFWKIFIERANVTKPVPRESLLLRAFITHYGQHSDVLRIVKILKQRRYKLAVLSNSIQPHVEYQYKIGLYQQFDVIVLSNRIGIKKPAPEAYYVTLEKLNVKPTEAFFVDDVAEYVTAANNLGIHGILYRNTSQFLIELQNMGIKI